MIILSQTFCLYLLFKQKSFLTVIVILVKFITFTIVYFTNFSLWNCQFSVSNVLQPDCLEDQSLLDLILAPSNVNSGAVYCPSIMMQLRQSTVDLYLPPQTHYPWHPKSLHCHPIFLFSSFKSIDGKTIFNVDLQQSLQ